MTKNIIPLNADDNAISGKFLLNGSIDGILPDKGLIIIPVRDSDDSPRIMDWSKKKSPYIIALHESLNKIYTNLLADDEVTHLIADKNWTMQDRQRWEEKLFSHVQKVMDDNKSIGPYRDVRTPGDMFIDQMSPISRNSCLEKGISFNVLANAAERRLLEAENTGLNKPGEYYMLVGRRTKQSEQRHTFILSETTAMLHDPAFNITAAPTTPELNFRAIVTGAAMEHKVCNSPDAELVHYFIECKSPEELDVKSAKDYPTPPPKSVTNKKEQKLSLTH